MLIRWTLAALTLSLLLVTTADADRIYALSASFEEVTGNPLNPPKNTITFSGDIVFSGDLSADGTFDLDYADLVAFELWVSCERDENSWLDCFPTRTFTRSSVLNPSDPEYTVEGGELVEIDILAEIPEAFIYIGRPDDPGTEARLNYFDRSQGDISCTDFSSSCSGPYTLTLVPEPSTASLAGLGLLALGAIGRRKRS